MSDTETQAVPENGAGWVVMWHPGTPDHDDGSKATAEVTVEAFEEVWSAKGWEVVGQYVDASAEQAPAPRAPSRPSTTPAPQGGEA